MSDLKEQLRQILAKEASAADSSLLDSAEKTPAPAATAENPADMQAGEASDLTTDAVGAEDRIQPGTSSEVTDVNAEAAAPGGVDATVIEGNKDGEAEKVLDIKDGEITKEEGIEVINKAANAIKAIGARLMNISDEELASGFRKEASAPMSAQEMLLKAASEGDTTAQFMVDLMSSYELGLAKKANDLEQLAAEGASPEQVAELENALNAQAMENPEMLMDETEAEAPAEGEGEIDPALAEVGAEIEAAAQEATLEVAEAILAEDPSISEDEALTAAQEAVVDAIMTIDAQQALGAQGENGEYLVNDEDAAGAVDELTKTASAHPMRDAIVGQLNQRFGLTPEAFAKRLGF